MFGKDPRIISYHNVLIQHHQYSKGYLDLDISPECLLARLALTLLAYNRSFFTKQRNVIIHNIVTCESAAAVRSPAQLNKAEFKKFDQQRPNSSTVGDSTQASVDDDLEPVKEDLVERWLDSEKGPCSPRPKGRGSPDITPTDQSFEPEGRHRGRNTARENGRWGLKINRLEDLIGTRIFEMPSTGCGGREISWSAVTLREAGEASCRCVQDRYLRDCNQGSRMA